MRKGLIVIIALTFVVALGVLPAEAQKGPIKVGFKSDQDFVFVGAGELRYEMDKFYQLGHLCPSLNGQVPFWLLQDNLNPQYLQALVTAFSSLLHRP